MVYDAMRRSQDECLAMFRKSGLRKGGLKEVRRCVDPRLFRYKAL